jgi:nicotinate-nucleotide adenylyltransferase
VKIGLYFGSFNPIHIGHLVIANYFAEFTDLNQIWFVVSPHNPLKSKSSLLDDYHRLELVNLAIDEYSKFRVSNIEFHLSQPNYTVSTLAHLHEKYPDYEFVLIMGADNLESIEKWKNFEYLLNNYQIYVYPRTGADGGPLKNHTSVHWVNAPIMEISATMIRKSIAEGKDVRYFLPEKSYDLIQKMNFYKR